ncbi:MAG: adenylate/guanylate cyclase domain-containing protein [Rhodobacteraceae bacterium]|nr:adenylate/guanylate cyclase domain-containing protein [Paracoccaceae bacterium]
MQNDSPILAQLPSDMLIKALELIDYMLGAALRAGDADIVLTEMSERIWAAGVPLDRSTSIIPLLHAEAVASARFWERGKGARSRAFPFQPDSGTEYAKSPAAEVHQTRKWLTLWLPDTADDAYNIVPDLKQDGFTHYVMMPVFMVNGMSNTFSFATRSDDGFSDLDFAFFKAIFPAISACQEILATHRIMGEVIRMYVGNEPFERILSGDVHRGQVTRIKSAILFADMRRFTELTADMEAEEATRLLNDYYDCIVPAIEKNGGEVLKFMGDGILAIFRATDDELATCTKAAIAAREGLKEVAGFDGEHNFDVGIALHFGDVAFGNVGSGTRLDYTVIGRDVNLASRVAGLCGTLDKKLLATAAFCHRAQGEKTRSLGWYDLKGLSTKEEIFLIST